MSASTAKPDRRCTGNAFCVDDGWYAKGWQPENE
jgi:hypothetical protein